MQGLVEWLGHQIGQVGQTQGDLTGLLLVTGEGFKFLPDTCTDSFTLATFKTQ